MSVSCSGSPWSFARKVLQAVASGILWQVVFLWKEFKPLLFEREFIENDLVDFARKNPGVVVYLQPKRHRKPKLSAEYCRFYSSFKLFWLIKIEKYTIKWTVPHSRLTCTSLIRKRFSDGSSLCVLARATTWCAC